MSPLWRNALWGSLGLLLAATGAGVAIAGYVWTGITKFNVLLVETGGAELSLEGAALGLVPQRSGDGSVAPEDRTDEDATEPVEQPESTDASSPTTLGFLRGAEEARRLKPLRGPVGTDLHRIDENRLLDEQGRGTLRPIVHKHTNYAAERTPLVLVHGINGQPADMQAIAAGLEGDQYQLYVWCYDDFQRRTSDNGRDLAGELQDLLRHTGARELLLVAHSMGGLVTRMALTVLADRGQLRQLDRVRFVAVDSPWHGFGGPSDQGLERYFFAMSKPFLPNGLEDMRAGSAMFLGETQGSDYVARRGLFGVELPEQVGVHLAFAATGSAIMDYEESGLVDRLATGDHEALDRTQQHRLAALRQSAAFVALESSWGAATPPRAQILASLRQVFPSFPGDHTSVLSDSSLMEFLRRSLDDD